MIEEGIYKAVKVTDAQGETRYFYSLRRFLDFLNLQFDLMTFEEIREVKK